MEVNDEKTLVEIRAIEREAIASQHTDPEGAIKSCCESRGISSGVAARLLAAKILLEAVDSRICRIKSANGFGVDFAAQRCHKQDKAGDE